MVHYIKRRLKRKSGKCTPREMDSSPFYPILSNFKGAISGCFLTISASNTIMTGKKQKKSKLELKSSPEALKKVLGKMYALKRQKEKELRIIDGIILHIQRQCHHKIIKDTRCEIAVCSICGSQFGWYCDKSPTHHCEYEVGENCIHCGQPEERK